MELDIMINVNGVISANSIKSSKNTAIIRVNSNPSAINAENALTRQLSTVVEPQVPLRQMSIRQRNRADET
jgi:hypothetical protein